MLTRPRPFTGQTLIGHGLLLLGLAMAGVFLGLTSESMTPWVYQHIGASGWYISLPVAVIVGVFATGLLMSTSERIDSHFAMAIGFFMFVAGVGLYLLLAIVSLVMPNTQVGAMHMFRLSSLENRYEKMLERSDQAATHPDNQAIRDALATGDARQVQQANAFLRRQHLLQDDYERFMSQASLLGLGIGERYMRVADRGWLSERDMEAWRRELLQNPQRVDSYNATQQAVYHEFMSGEKLKEKPEDES